MPNASVIHSLKVAAAYEREGFGRGLAEVARWAAQHAELSDNLVLSRTAVNAKADVVAAGTARIYTVSIASPAGATLGGYLQLFNAAAAAVTLGTTAPEIQIKFDAAQTRSVWIYDSADGVTLPTAFSWAATTTASGATAVTAPNTPTVTALYRP